MTWTVDAKIFITLKGRKNLLTTSAQKISKQHMNLHVYFETFPLLNLFHHIIFTILNLYPI